MRTFYTRKNLLITALLTCSGILAQAQSTLEFASGSGSSGNGITLSSQVITFKENAANPANNTFIPFITPATTVTFALSNQQYAIPTSEISTGAGVSFGGGSSSSSSVATTSALFPAMNAISSASASNFTASSGTTAGQGISPTSNYATELFTSVMGLYHANAATNGRYYMATLTITFSTPVSNPVIHIVGLGGAHSSLGFTTELDLQTANVTLSKLSGSTELNVSSTQITNSATHPAATTGSGAASGSVKATANNITSLVFKLYLRGDGVLSSWSSSTEHPGDGWLIGVSTLTTSLYTLPVTLSGFTATAHANSTLLQWATSMEANTSSFEVEYSKDGSQWQTIGSVRAAGTSNTEINYSFTHNSPAQGTNYYRLREIDNDGKSVYSSVQAVTFNTASRITAYPNPVVSRLTLSSNGVALESVTIMTLSGIRLQQVNNIGSNASIDMSGYPAGVLLIVLKDVTGNTETIKVLKG